MRIWEKSHHSIFTFKTSNPRVSRVHSKNVQKDKQTSRLCSAFNENKIKRKCLFKKKNIFRFPKFRTTTSRNENWNHFFSSGRARAFPGYWPMSMSVSFLGKLFSNIFLRGSEWMDRRSGHIFERFCVLSS